MECGGGWGGRVEKEEKLKERRKQSPQGRPRTEGAKEPCRILQGSRAQSSRSIGEGSSEALSSETRVKPVSGKALTSLSALGKS